MDKELKKFRREIALKNTIKTISITFIFFIIYLFLVDNYLNDFVADFTVRNFGIKTYLWFVSHKQITLFLSAVIIFCIIEYLIIRKMSNSSVETLIAMDKVLKNPEEEIVMSDNMKLLEGKINSLRVDLVKNQNKATEAMQKKDNLIMYMAHDLKTPLTSIIGYLTLLKEEKNLSKKLQDKYIDIALKKAYRVEELTNEFFDITRYNLQELQINKKEIDLAYLFEQLIEECYPMLEKKNLKININKPISIKYFGDGDKLARAFENIIKNAINYCYADSVIEIDIKNINGKININIKNKCDKIPEYKLNKIFEQFYRVDDSRTSENGGAGLGLAITKKIIEMHNGTINVKNDNEYIEFLISLP